IHLPLDCLQSVDVSLYRAIAPSFGHRCPHRRFVSANAFGKSSYFRTARRFAFHEPVTERPARALANQIRELICQAQRIRQLVTGASNRVDSPLLFGFAVLGPTNPLE